ncbi:MAG: hypothetical protein ACI83Y_001732 [Candidatus Azotimanducaceae bacterium]|jgi:uncharacterized protein (TIGR02466 family)
MDALELFATPVTIVQVHDADVLNQDLASQFIKRSQEEQSLRRSNAGGWHSMPDLGARARDEPALGRLMDLILEGSSAFLTDLGSERGIDVWPSYRLEIEAWAMVMGDGDYTVPHDHAESHISGVYYLDAGDADPTVHADSGVLVFQDPRGGLAQIPGMDLLPAAFAVSPEDGILVMFPGFLTHYVHPYRGTRPRVSVSFNVRVEPLPPS